MHDKLAKLVFLPFVAGMGILTRWFLQGSYNLYTSINKRLYIKDPDLGWRVVEGPVWLGLDSLLITAASAIVVLVGAWWARKILSSKYRPLLRVLLWVAAILPVGIPAWAFVTGLGPSNAVDALPQQSNSIVPIGVDGSLPNLPAGRYDVVDHPQVNITAQLTAGGEVFEARFSGASGYWQGNPGSLTEPIEANILFESASVDTGIRLRSKHAREELKVHEYPQISFALTRILGVAQREQNAIGFVADGVVHLMGGKHRAKVSGVVRRVTQQTRARFTELADRPAFIVNANFLILIDQTAIGNDGTFSSNKVPIQATVIFVQHNPKEPP